VLFALDAVFVRTGASRGFDLGVDRWVQATIRWRPLELAMEGTNWVAGIKQTIGAVLVTLVVLLIWRSLRLALEFAVSIGVASGVGEVLKVIFHRPRPSHDLVHVIDVATGWSFPSGHAIYYTWLAACLVLLVAPRLGRPVRAVIWVVAAALIVVGCLGRLWAGVHWPTDVIGGFLVGVACVTLVLRASDLVEPRIRVWIRR
jgi:membrane-associated phospholipid phosphatase